MLFWQKDGSQKDAHNPFSRKVSKLRTIMCRPDDIAQEGKGPQNVGQWLYHCLEVETEFKYYEKTEEDHRNSLKAIVEDPGNSLNKLDDIAVVVSVLEDHEPFDFDSVHHRPTPVEVVSHPIVFMFFYKVTENKCFAKLKTDLTMYDGVTCLHGLFDMLEHLETGKFSPYPFTGRQEQLPENQFENFQKQLARVEEAKANTEFTPGVWSRHPLMGQMEDSLPERPARRFTEVNISYKELMQKIDEIKNMLDIPFYSLTVNHSPMVALSLCPTLEEAMHKKSIAANIALPPVGVGGPAPMDAAHVEMLFNTLFINNYGRHNPQISGKVVGHIWDWAGFYASFAPFFFIGTIQGKLFMSYSASPDDFDSIEKSGILDGIGSSKPFRYHKFYPNEVGLV